MFGQLFHVSYEALYFKGRSTFLWVFFVLLGAGFLYQASSKGSSEVLSSVPLQQAYAQKILVQPGHKNVSHTSSSASLATLRTPLLFVPNQGQFANKEIQFVARGAGYQIAMQPSQVALSLPVADATGHNAIVRMDFVGANAAPVMAGNTEQITRYNYYRGSNPQHWVTEVPSYKKVKYQSLYPHIDAEFYGAKGQLEYDFIVLPGGVVSDIQLDYSGIQAINLDAEGNLLLQVAGQTLTQSKPYTYQIINGQKIEVVSQYVVNKTAGSAGFQVAHYNPAYPLVIDPTVLFSNYLGGSQLDHAYAVTVDSIGHAYVTGETRSPDFLTATATRQQTGGTGSAAFVSKFDAAGNLLVKNLFNGNGDEIGKGIQIGADGQLYVTGETSSFSIPVSNNIVTDPVTGFIVDVISVLGGGFPVTDDAYKNSTGDPEPSEIFVMRLDPVNLTLKYGTYFGGTNAERGTDIAVDANGKMYVSFITLSSDFPVTASAYQSIFSGQPNTQEEAGFFVLSTDGTTSTLEYSTLLGGSNRDYAHAIALGPNNEVHLAGTTASVNFNITANALYPTNLSTGVPLPGNNVFVNGNSNAIGNISGNEDGFLAKFDITQSGAASAIYVTYFGGRSTDEILGMDVDAAGNVYLTGSSFSFDLSDPCREQVSPSSACSSGLDELTDFDAFYAKLDNAPGGTLSVLASQLLADGSSSTDVGWDIAVDNAGIAYIVGETQPLQNNPNNPGLGLNASFSTLNALPGHGTTDFVGGGGIDVFTAQFDAAGTLQSSSLFGGSGHDSAFAFPSDGIRNGFGIAVMSVGGAYYLVGSTQSEDFIHDSASNPNNPIPAETSNTGSVNSGNAVQNGFLIGVGPTVDLTISKSTTATTVLQGSVISYDIIVTNVGAELAAGVVVTEDLNQGGATAVFQFSSDSLSVCVVNTPPLLECPLADIPAGTSATITLSLVVLQVGAVANQASVVAVGKVLNPANLSSDPLQTGALNVLPSADMSVTVTTDPASPAAVPLNTNLDYIVTVTNDGASLAESVVLTNALPINSDFVSVDTPLGFCNATTINDAVSPCGCTLDAVTNTLSCDLGNLPVGSQQVTITATPTVLGLISNTVTVDAQTGDLSTGNNSFTLESDVAPSGDMAVSHPTIVAQQVPGGLQISGQGVPGEPVEYIFNVTNTGATQINGATVNVPVPTGVLASSMSWTCQSLVGGGVCLGATSGTGAIVDGTLTLPVNGSVQYIVTAVSDPAFRGSLVAEINTSMPLTLADVNLNDNTLTFVDVLTPVTNLVITKQDRFDPVLNTTNTNQSVITYDIVVTNSGPSQATNVVVIDTLPGNAIYLSSTPACDGPTNGELSCDLGALNAGSAFTIEVRVEAPTAAPVTLFNTASVTSAERVQPTSVTEETRVVDVASAAADLGLIVVASDANDNGFFEAGEAVTYTLTVSNAGPFDATNVSATLNFPNAAAFTAVTGLSCTTVTADEISCLIGDVPANGSVSATATYSLPTTTGNLTVNGKVSSATMGDPNLVNNIFTLPFDVVALIRAVGSSNATGGGGGSMGIASLFALMLLAFVRRVKIRLGRRHYFSILLVGLLLSSSASAAPQDEPRWYLQASFGQSDFTKFDANDLFTDVQTDGFAVTSMGLDNARKGQEYLLGYRFRPNWAAEISYIDLDNASANAQGGIVDVDAFLNSVLNHMPNKSKGVLINPVFYKTVHNFEFFGKAGVFFASSEITATALSGTTVIKKASRTESGTEVFMGAGVVFNLTDYWGLLLEWKSFFGEESVNFLSGGVRYTLPEF